MQSTIVDCSNKMIRTTVESSDMQKVEKYRMREIQREFLPNCWIRLKHLGPVMNNDRIIAGSRMESRLKRNWNSEIYILLPANHQFP